MKAAGEVGGRLIAGVLGRVFKFHVYGCCFRGFCWLWCVDVAQCIGVRNDGMQVEVSNTATYDISAKSK